MAKLALIFVIVSLFALCMAARIPREEPTTVNPIQEIISKLQAAWTPEQQEEYKKKGQELLNQVVEQAQQFSNTLNESIQKLGEQKSS
ncbi:uncharacterized protein Dwil_GK17438 [Drosophila willistoni]|uniref:Uncharacterized protein n=1 Tax=Drosophila willistoni TaxID=7260 RepID=B4MM73_DROWI|nr:neuropeptide-like 2 [Drosophila willistoni]EDW73218.1 uncharacterized protein Dwil_GK17438 [Drosophila willistoni]